jgi:hypothetical protein
MMRMRSLIFVAALIAMTSTTQAREFEVGQLWSYHTRPGEENSLVLINFIESVPKLGTVYHISVLRVQLPNMNDGSRFETDLPHFPVLKEALDKSVVTHVGDREPNEAYRRGYDTWRAAFDAGRAGAFTVSIAEVVSIVEETVKKNSAGQPSKTSLKRTPDR